MLDVHFDDTRWKQESLHPSLGGLGIRFTSSMAHASFLSACSFVPTFVSTLSGGAPDVDALSQWRDQTHGAIPPQSELSHKVSSWSKPIDDLVGSELLS